MNERPDINDWEAQINALLDGELDDHQAERLKSAAEDDQALARAIIEAYQLQQALATLPRERAPVSLRRKLRRIPAQQRRQERRGAHGFRWAAALAAIPLVLIAVSQLGPREPSEAEIEQARKDLALAFAYLEKASRTTRREIESSIDDGMGDPVTGKVLQTLNQQFDLDKEKGA